MLRMISSKPEVSDEQLTGGRVKGGMLKAHLEWVLQNHGSAGMTQLRQELGVDTAGQISHVLPTSWIMFETLVAVDRAIEKLFSRGNPSFLKELGAFSARINLSTTYRLYRSDDIHEFFRRSALLHLQFQDFGEAEYEKLTEKSGAMTHRDYACYSPVYCRSALGYYEQAVAEHGASASRAVETSCRCRGDAHCRFELRWS